MPVDDVAIEMPAVSKLRLSFPKLRKKKQRPATAPGKPSSDVAAGSEHGNRLRQSWFGAVKDQDIVQVKELVKQDVDINWTEEGWSALHIAAWNGYPGLCGLLISLDANVNSASSNGSTPVSLASQQGHVDTVRLLIGCPHCDVNRTATLGENQDVTPLHLAAQHGHLAVVNLLLQARAVVNASMTVRGIKGVTPLHLAVQGDHLDVMDVLIGAGSDIHSSTQGSPAPSPTQTLVCRTSASSISETKSSASEMSVSKTSTSDSAAVKSVTSSSDSSSTSEPSTSKTSSMDTSVSESSC